LFVLLHVYSCIFTYHLTTNLWHIASPYDYTPKQDKDLDKKETKRAKNTSTSPKGNRTSTSPKANKNRTLKMHKTIICAGIKPEIIGEYENRKKKYKKRKNTAGFNFDETLHTKVCLYCCMYTPAYLLII
jgi:hypothetical protein